MRVSRLVAFVLVAAMAVFSGCHANERAPRARDGFVATEVPQHHGEVAEPSATPLVGAIMDDGSEADVRPRGDAFSDRATLQKSPGGSPPAEPASPERMLVYSGQVRVEVAKPQDLMANFREQVTKWGGHLQRQDDWTLVVRVPASKFEEAFQWVRGSGRVLSESRQTGDVTEEFIDLGIRLDNAKKSRDRLLEVLQRAEKVEDILKVEAELRRLTEEIERMEGRRKFLSDQVALSTIEATFQPLTEVPVSKRVRRPSRFPWINAVGAEQMMEGF